MTGPARRTRRPPRDSEPIDSDAVAMIRPYLLVPPPPRPVEPPAESGAEPPPTHEREAGW
ncbi:hypothetical protein QNO07_22030 [Streptomyces sp. 549]|uniref:hypothetical protein n=1 Tax=Streptomyces sp. 549 TaxID=3049076 RepID=UPI0024C31FA9|nr:hypothetical protein [Streptomyces sp. 549]MDK1476065.1 hypothetical protein [Streptomyces sp. 549]